jgi:uncharacterized membrane protein YeaQ/YmgE (transglycosylase-associated protein family)
MTILIVILVVVLALVFSVAVIGLALKLLWLALVGLVLGALARLVIPGRQQVGVLWTSLCGIGGSLIGGAIASAADFGWLLSFLVAVAVAAGLILLVESWQGRRATLA